VAWFHCFSGIAGDMALGSLIDAGADIDEVRSLCERLPVGGWGLEAEAVMRTGIAGTKVHVHTKPSSVVRTAAHITGMVEEARLPDRIRQRALATFEVLARAEPDPMYTDLLRVFERMGPSELRRRERNREWRRCSSGTASPSPARGRAACRTRP